jgi:hypothetical protein
MVFRSACPEQAPGGSRFLVGGNARFSRIVRPATELQRNCAALILAMETSPDNRPKVDVHEAPDDVSDVIIWTIDDAELERLRESRRGEPERAH